MPAPGEITEDYLIDEWAREFYLEGRRRSDLVRFGRFTSGTYLWDWKGGTREGKAVSEIYNRFPIPDTDLNNNPKFDPERRVLEFFSGIFPIQDKSPGFEKQRQPGRFLSLSWYIPPRSRYTFRQQCVYVIKPLSLQIHMKRLALPCLFSVFLILLSAACSGYMPDEDEETSATETSECHLQLAVRSTDEVKINYPLSVFLFDDTGELVLQTEVSDAETPFTHRSQ